MQSIWHLCKLLLTGTLFFVTPAYAQVRTIGLSYNFHPASNYAPPADSVDRDGRTQLSEINFQSNLTLRQKIDTGTAKVRLLSATIWGRYSVLRNEGFNKTILPSRLLASNVGLQYYRTINPRWSYIAFVSGRINSDLKRIDLHDVFLSGGVIFLRQFSPKFRLGMGLLVHNTFGTPLPWPAITVDWRPGNRLQLDIRVPDEGAGIAYKLGLAYKLNKRWHTEFSFKPHALTYDVEPVGKINNRLMSFWQLPFGLSLHAKTKQAEFFGGVGFTALRSFSYAEKKLSKMFSKFPYHGLGAHLFINAGMKVQL